MYGINNNKRLLSNILLVADKSVVPPQILHSRLSQKSPGEGERTPTADHAKDN
jgi:hypothetical protein